jgi:tetratricopeptide (TPR) repeat protein
MSKIHIINKHAILQIFLQLPGLDYLRTIKFCHFRIKKRLIYFLSLFICFIFLFSCHTTQKATNSKVKNDKEAKALNELEFKGTYLEGVKQYLLGNYEVAESLFTQCIHKKESHDPSLYQLAKISLAQNNFFQAKEYVKKAININQSNSWYKLLLIDILLIQNKPTEAIQIYSQLLDKHPNKIEYLKNVSKLYIGLGKYQEALEILNKLGSIKGTSAEISLTKIEIYKQLNQNNNIISEYKTLIDANPFEYKYQTLLAEFLTSLEKYDEAFDIYQRIVEQNPEDNTVKLSLYEYYRAINEPKKSN